MLMKERAKIKGRHQIKLLVSEENSLGNIQSQDSNLLNYSATMSSFEASREHNH
jgi:hypothetical protein